MVIQVISLHFSRSRRSFRGVTAALILANALYGCQPSGPPMAPVSGVVTCDSEPVQHALVTFFPQGVPDGKIGFARTDEEGRFEAVTTFAANDGVVVGEHLATVTESWPPGVDIPLDDSGMQKSPPRGPWRPEFRDSVSTPLTFTVVAGQHNHFEIDLSN